MTDSDELEQRVDDLEREVASLKERLPSRSEPSSRQESPVRDPPRTDDSTSPETPSGSSKSLTGRLEGQSSVTWLGVIGVIALVFATGFAIRLAIQEGLIGPLGRIVLGILSGVVLSGIGAYAAKQTRHDRWGWTVAGGGIAITYFSVYASYAFETYRTTLGTPLELVVGGLSVITIVAAVTAVREDKYVLCAEAFLLGFVTAFFTRTVGGEALVYAVLLTAGIAAVVRYRNWMSLALGGVVGSYLLYGVWYSETADPVVLSLAGVYLVATFLTYLMATVQPRGNHGISEVTTGLNALSAVLLLSALVVDLFGSQFDVVPWLGLAVVFAGVCAATDRPELVGGYSLRRLHIAPAITAGALTGAVALASVFWSTIAAALLIPLAVVAATRTGRREYRLTGHLLFCGALLKLVYDATAFGHIGGLLEPAVTYSLAALAAAAYLTYWVLETQTDIEAAGSIEIPHLYLWSGAALVAGIPMVEVGAYLLTGAWAVLALSLLGLGFLYEKKTLRLQALCFFGLTTAKVFLIDTQGLEPIPRILSLVILGVLLIVAAFAYSKFSDRLLDHTQ